MPARRTDSAARPTRRRILLATGGVVLAASAGWGGNWLAAYKRHARSNVGTLGFRNRLRIPELLDPRAFDGGARRYELELAPGSSEFLPGRKTATWGANGPYLAPTLRMRDGDPVALTVRNALPEPTTLHWHGMHLPPAMGGGPHQMVAPGAVWRPRWTVHQPASTLWYHPHPHGSTGSHAYRGIAGMIIVNGTHDPHFEVTTERVRLRLLNGSNARVYELGFPGDKTFHLAATENGLLKRPLALTRLRLAPGERAEIVVSFTAGEKALLRSFPPELGVGFPVDRFAGGDGNVHAFHVHGATFDVLEVDGAKPPAHLRGPKDTVYLPGTTTVRLAVRFDTLTDERTPYMYHCHVLRHEDDGMMGQFLVVAPGREDKVSRTLDAPGAHGGSHGSHR
ncbi:multicopper oxidase family protein [Streptomyces griseus]|uniref:multicopper oxidase family protein n=1 Tax=Streptomyces griseus TaxID=1911 RepID=UPI0038184F6C